jgi:hypothetical protein
MENKYLSKTKLFAPIISKYYLSPEQAIFIWSWVHARNVLGWNKEKDRAYFNGKNLTVLGWRIYREMRQFERLSRDTLRNNSDSEQLWIALAAKEFDITYKQAYWLWGLGSQKLLFDIKSFKSVFGDDLMKTFFYELSLAKKGKEVFERIELLRFRYIKVKADISSRKQEGCKKVLY